MEFNRLTLGIGVLLLLVLGAVFIWKPDISPTALVTGKLTTYNPFVGSVSGAMEDLFRDNPQAVIEQDGRIGLLLPGGNSVQFTQDGSTTDQDVVLILNPDTTKISEYNEFPVFKQNEFTYIPAEQLLGENSYVRAQYPHGLYLMPVNVD